MGFAREIQMRMPPWNRGGAVPCGLYAGLRAAEAVRGGFCGLPGASAPS
jgi:hypothetical protein